MNQYEQAFGGWLNEQRLRYTSVNQTKRAVFRQNKIKSFDFLVYPEQNSGLTQSFGHLSESLASPVIVEVKGRLYKGSDISALNNIQCWVTMEDITGLLAWQDAFDGPLPYVAYFVFAFRLEYPFTEILPDGVYEYDSEVFCFYAVSLEDYIKHMTVRSKSWQTLTLSTADFRRLCIPGYRLFNRTSQYETIHPTDSRVCS